MLWFLTWVPWSLRIVRKSICVCTFFTLGKRSCSDLGILVTAVNLLSYSDPGEGGSSGRENGRRTWDRWLDRGCWRVKAERCWEKIGIGEKIGERKKGWENSCQICQNVILLYRLWVCSSFRGTEKSASPPIKNVALVCAWFCCAAPCQYSLDLFFPF